MRHCSKPGCNRPAVGTLTYDYSNQTVVLGPLSTVAEPHTYDMCEQHMSHMTVPKGWEVVRLAVNYDAVPPSEDDLMELVEAVRSAASHADGSTVPSDEIPGGLAPFSSRPKLEVISEEEPVGDAPEKGPFG